LPTPKSSRPPDSRSTVAACSASSTGLCQGSTITAVPSRIVEVLAPIQVSRFRRRRDLAEPGEVMLDDEGLHVVFDEFLEPLGAVHVGPATSRLGTAEKTEFHGLSATYGGLAQPRRPPAGDVQRPTIFSTWRWPVTLQMPCRRAAIMLAAQPKSGKYDSR
jgi:hypothetical protein